MRRRMMMAEKKVVNLFDKTTAIMNTRLTSSGSVFSGDSVANISFSSSFIPVTPSEIYVLIREKVSNDKAYNRWCFYNNERKYNGYGNSVVAINTITIPENCHYIRFNGLIEDIDNVKFYKV